MGLFTGYGSNVHAAIARFSLLENGLLTLEDIALLAGVNIKTVRNAISSKGEDRLVLAGGKHEKPLIDAHEAYRWLLTKKGFTGPFLYDEEPPYESYGTLGQFRHHCFVLRTLSGLSVLEVAKQLNWNTEVTDAYAKLENIDVSDSLALLTPDVLLHLATLYQSKNLNTFVIEGSRIVASLVAEMRASVLIKSAI